LFKYVYIGISSKGPMNNAFFDEQSKFQCLFDVHNTQKLPDVFSIEKNFDLIVWLLISGELSRLCIQ
jgi:hypothetical protein